MSIKFCIRLLILSTFALRALALPSAVRGVVVVPPGLSNADAQTYATTHDKFLLSDYLDATRPGQENDRQLKQKLERAQRAWLGGEIEQSRGEFRALTEMSLKADWRDGQREVLQMAHLRLAQTSSSGTERESWLDAAARLYGDIPPNAALFPPPLLAEYETSRKRVATATADIDLREAFTDFKYVLIDGRKIELSIETHVRLTPGLHRLTAYSDSHESVTEFLTAAQLRVLRLSPPSLTSGLCRQAKLRDRAELPTSLDIEIYSGEACPQDIANALNGSRLISEPRSLPVDGPDEKTGTTTSSGGRTWLWIVGGALIAGAGYALATRHDPTPEPVHRTGF